MFVFIQHLLASRGLAPAFDQRRPTLLNHEKRDAPQSDSLFLGRASLPPMASKEQTVMTSIGIPRLHRPVRVAESAHACAKRQHARANAGCDLRW